MAYSRQYTLAEIKGMLQIYRNNRQFLGVDDEGKVQRAKKPMHAQTLHGGASRLELTKRVNTPHEPRMSGTYWNEDDQAAATHELLNSVEGQEALRRLDIGENRAAFTALLTPNRYMMANAVDNSKAAGVGRNDPARKDAGATHRTAFAVSGFVLCVSGVGGQLQIQTSYPIV